MLVVTSAELQAAAGALLWPFLRVLALVAAAPVLGHRAVPARVKIGLALLVTALLAPTLPPAPPLDHPAAFALVLEQLAIGLALALAMHVAFAATALAGDMIGLQMGLSFGTFVDPSHAGQSPMIGTFLGLLATLVFFALDGHLALLAALAESFRHAPVGGAPPPAETWRALVAWGGELFRLGLQMALPVLAAMLAGNLALGVLARAAPQLNLFAVGFPAALILGLALLAAALPALDAPMREAIARGIGLLAR
ncbi:MAG: flagellar biosynthetic protein FliR [Burkholderiales bacterium]|nr:flagellar biosynthetic protein FliR [Burkholderiales bacterium]